MAVKDVNIIYLYPVKYQDKKSKLFDLKPILEGLKNLSVSERILDLGKEENVQLKKISYDGEKKRWFLSFLRNTTDAPFKNKISDNTDKAEALGDDEFVGKECCAIYDEQSNILALQSNRYSVSIHILRKFIYKFIDDKDNDSYNFNVITYKDKYSNINLENNIDYKSVIIGFTDISELQSVVEEDDDDAVKYITKIANNMNALNGKFEFNVGRKTDYLNKNKLKSIVDFFKRNKKSTSSLKVKMIEDGTINLIDLLNYKVISQVKISVTKSDPKTFDKILKAMDSKFDFDLEETFDKCKTYTAV
ncbi:DUF6731 family protein [Clostridium butyricum]